MIDMAQHRKNIGKPASSSNKANHEASPRPVIASKANHFHRNGYAPRGTPVEIRNEFVRRKIEGHEKVADLAREANVSIPAFYQWIDKYKADAADLAKRADMKPQDIVKSDNITLKVENERLVKENRVLREKVLAMMIKAGEL